MSKRILLYLVFALLQLFLIPGWSLTTDSFASQREQFIAARKALKQGNQDAFRRLKAGLKSYPLYGYLEYDELRRNLAKASPARISRFLHHYQGQPLADRLYYSWLHSLGKRRQWDTYLEFYTPQKSVTLQCYQLRASLQKKPDQRDSTLQKGLALWLVGKSQPDACDPLFAALEKAGLLTRDYRWERIRRAFDNRKTSLAKHIARKLPKSDQRWVKRWQAMHRKPDATLDQGWTRLDAGMVRDIVLHGIKRLARSNQEAAWKHWKRLSRSHAFNAAEQGQVMHDIALFAALNNHPHAAEWLTAVPGPAVTSRIRLWRVRNALLNRDWRSALIWIDVLEPAERNSHQWRYWRAVALEKSGDTQQALTHYRDVSSDRNFYSFLAADRLKIPYHMKHQQEPLSEQSIRQLAQLPGIVRARELMLADMNTEARREWRAATADFDTQQLKQAAVLADRWGWHDRAIATAAKARYWSDLTLRFPLAHLDLIKHNAERYNIDPALIYGLIRQESAFMEDARSSVGALGLMQLMPGTARLTSRHLGMRYPGKTRLLEAENNIPLGSAYFRRMLDRYDDSPVLAAAAYNAGPHRVNRWLPKHDTLPAALWLLRIPFHETHGYVQRVLAYATVFDWREQRPRTRISERMPDVKPAAKD